MDLHLDGRTGRSPSEHRAAVAAAGTDIDPRPAMVENNLRLEFHRGHLAPELAEVADTLATLYHFANAKPSAPTIAECRNLGALTGPERHARACQVLRLVRYRCGHLWPDLLLAVVDDASMTEIGGALGGNSRDSARLGRQRVSDALQFAEAALADMERWATRQEQDIASATDIKPIIARAIGQRSAAPDWIHQVANDDLRRVMAA